VVAQSENPVDKPELLTRDGAAIGSTIERWIAGGPYKERIA
jgi:hypothetical protein